MEYLLVLAAVGAALWLLARVLRGRRADAGGSGAERIAAADWREFERLSAEALRGSGFKVRENPGDEAGADGGIDLLAERGGSVYAVQCKHWRRKDVGVSVVRETFGAMAARGDDACMVVCSGPFSATARDWARGKPVHLVDGRALARMLDGKRFEAVVDRPSVEERREEKRRGRTGRGVVCPVCGAEMLMRRIGKGKRRGRSFWGCVRYPECKGTREAV